MSELKDEHARLAPPSDSEKKQINDMRTNLVKELASGPQHPELISDWKLLRFLRGHGNVEAACTAYRQMLAYRKEYDVDAFRSTLLATGGVDSMPWPPLMDEFLPLREVIWHNVPPVYHHGQDYLGNPISMVSMSHYDMDKIATENLADLWFRMVIYVNEYFDLLLHAKSEDTGKMICRHNLVDVTMLGLGDFSSSALKLISRVGNSSEHYPESVFRTIALNVGIVAQSISKIVFPFVPKQTLDKIQLQNSNLCTHITTLDRLPRRFGGICNCLICQKYVHKLTEEVYIPAGQIKQIKMYVEDKTTMVDRKSVV